MNPLLDNAAMGLSTTALVVFCRRPLPGSGKQRLARVLGHEAALAVAEALLECTLEDAQAWPGGLVLSPASFVDSRWAERLLDRPVSIEPQPEGNLGERLNVVDQALRRQGWQRLIFIGTDAPSLSVDDLLAAAAELERVDVVLGPAADGGVTLMGSRIPWPALADLPWSQPTLGQELQKQCRKHCASVSQVRASYDVDEIEDLATACRELAEDERPARRRLRERLAAILRDSNVVDSALSVKSPV